MFTLNSTLRVLRMRAREAQLRREHSTQCAHCLELIELSPYSALSPERVLLMREAFTVEHKGCEQYAGDLAGARRHRNFVRNMRKQMKRRQSCTEQSTGVWLMTTNLACRIFAGIPSEVMKDCLSYVEIDGKLKWPGEGAWINAAARIQAETEKAAPSS